MNNKFNEDDRLKKLKQLMAKNEFLLKAGINPDLILANAISFGDGFELPFLAQDNLERQALINIVSNKYHEPKTDLNDALILGQSIQSGKPIGIPFNDTTTGVGIFGASGSGKTNAELYLINQFRQRNNIETLFWDLKGEGRRFLDFWPDAMVFTPSNWPCQWLEPPTGCDPIPYFTGFMSEIRTEFDLRSETFPLSYGIYERVVRALKPGDPYPSISDFRRILEWEADHVKRENLFTLARVFLNLEVILGPNARIRKAPDISGRYKVVAIEFVGQDPKILRLFLGFYFNRLLIAAHQQEHGTTLRKVIIIDEASPICSIELNNQGTANLSSVKRFATQARFTGTALIIGAQNISQIDNFVKNVGTVMVFRTPSVNDSIDAAKMLGLANDSIEQLMNLKVGEAWVRGVGWTQPVKIQAPLFQI